MAVSKADRERMERIGRDLSENENDEEVTGEALDDLIRDVNERRAASGQPPLRKESDRRPEEGIYERAMALGMRRIDRKHS